MKHVKKISDLNSQERRGHWTLKEYGVTSLNQPRHGGPKWYVMSCAESNVVLSVENTTNNSTINAIVRCMYSAAAVSTTPPNVRQSRSAVYSVLEHTRLHTLLVQSADSLALSRCPITALLLCNALLYNCSSGPLERNSNLGLVLIPFRASQLQYNFL